MNMNTTTLSTFEISTSLRREAMMKIKEGTPDDTIMDYLINHFLIKPIEAETAVWEAHNLILSLSK
jgi:cytochrome c-type biogenesis protein CcmH/NrfF